METLKKNQIITANIEGYTSEGAGIARYNGMVIFVQGAIEGERCDILIMKVGKNMAYGKVETLFSPSPSRIEPGCALKGCGGCDFRHMTYEEELRFKHRRVVDAMTRIAGLQLPVAPVLASPRTQRYRNKAIFNVGSKNGQPVMGFYRERSHDIVPLQDCLIQGDASCRVSSVVLEWMKKYGVAPYDEKAHEGLVRHIFTRTAQNGAMMTCISVNGNRIPAKDSLIAAMREAVPEMVSIMLNVNTRIGNSVLGDAFIPLWGQTFLEDSMCGLRFRISPASFYQINTPQAERLYQLALELSGCGKDDTVLDLYCGIGTISLCFAKAAKRVIGAEVVPEAVDNARENAELNGIQNAEFIMGDADDAARLVRSGDEKIDIVVVDPPRKGLAPDVIETILAIGPQKVVYISCDCATMARDLKLFAAGGYAPGTVHPVDLFPRTRHVETVVLITKKND